MNEEQNELLPPWMQSTKRRDIIQSLTASPAEEPAVINMEVANV